MNQIWSAKLIRTQLRQDIQIQDDFLMFVIENEMLTEKIKSMCRSNEGVKVNIDLRYRFMD